MRNPDEELESRTLRRDYPPSHLIRVNDAARRSRQTRFAALLRHVDVVAGSAGIDPRASIAW